MVYPGKQDDINERTREIEEDGEEKIRREEKKGGRMMGITRYKGGSWSLTHYSNFMIWERAQI